MGKTIGQLVDENGGKLPIKVRMEGWLRKDEYITIFPGYCTSYAGYEYTLGGSKNDPIWELYTDPPKLKKVVLKGYYYKNVLLAWQSSMHSGDVPALDENGVQLTKEIFVEEK